MKAKSDHLPLTESDCFVLALDYQMRSAGLRGNICRLVLRLDGLFKVERLRSIVQSCDSVNWLANMRMRRRFPLAAPYWFSSHPNCQVTIAEHRATVPRSNGAGVCNNYVDHILHPGKGPGIAFDLAHYTDNKTDFVLNWHHALMDARAAESLLLQISGPNADVALSEGEFFRNFDPVGGEISFSESAGSGAWLNPVKRLVFARQSLVFIEKIHRYPVATLVPKEKGRCGNSHSYRPVHFSEAESKNIEANCDQLGAGFRRSLFILAAAIRALHAVRIARGENVGAYVIPVPQDLRKRGMTGPILSNHVTFLFYRVESEDMTSIKTLIASLKQQMTEQVRLKFHRAFSVAMGMFRFLPLSLYAKVLRRPSRDKMATFFFSDTGDNLQNIEDFLGAHIDSLCHLAPVPLPPGVAVISGWFRGRLWVVLSCVAGCLTDQEQELFESIIRSELLGQR